MQQPLMLNTKCTNSNARPIDMLLTEKKKSRAQGWGIHSSAMAEEIFFLGGGEVEGCHMVIVAVETATGRGLSSHVLRRECV
jgi:hypothetical protein